MAGGSLNKFLESKEKLTDNDLMLMVQDIVTGMLHLHAENIVHRDLAARNLLVCYEDILSRYPIPL